MKASDESRAAANALAALLRQKRLISHRDLSRYHDLVAEALAEQAVDEGPHLRAERSPGDSRVCRRDGGLSVPARGRARSTCSTGPQHRHGRLAPRARASHVACTPRRWRCKRLTRGRARLADVSGLWDGNSQPAAGAARVLAAVSLAPVGGAASGRRESGGGPSSARRGAPGAARGGAQDAGRGSVTVVSEQTTAFIAWCESCDWRSQHPTRAIAVSAALTHRGLNSGHVVRVQNPDAPK